MSARTPNPDPTQIREYLLRRMSDVSRARFEEAYFKDDTLLDRIEAEEDLLVSDYVLGRLGESDRRRFEQSLLGTPYYAERVQTTSRLKLRIAEHQSFRPRAPRGKPAGSGRRQETRQDEHLFPGRSGSAVALSVLLVLLIAAVVSSIRLKAELERALHAQSREPAPTAPATPAPAALQTIAFEADAAPGPSLRRVLRDGQAQFLLVAPRQALPPTTREWRILVIASDGSLAWESPQQKLADLPPGSDLSMRLPAGMPAAGRSAMLLKAGGVFEDAVLTLGVLEVVDGAPAPAR